MVHIREGQIAILRDGRQLKIVEVLPHHIPYYPLWIVFADGSCRSYMMSGQHHYHRCKHDIVGLIDPPI